MKTIRIDQDVRDALLARRVEGETNHSQVIDRLIRTRSLRERLDTVGLSIAERAELHWLEGRA